MPRKKNDTATDGQAQPSDLTELKKLVTELVNKLDVINNEIAVLKGDRTDVIAEYKEKLDMKSFRVAMSIVKLRSKVQHKSAFDSIMEVLDGDSQADEVQLELP